MNDGERFLNDLFEAEYYKLFGYCRKRLYDEQTAEDCVGEVFFRAHDNIDKLMIHPNPHGWIFKTAQLVVKEVIRKSCGRRKMTVLIDSFESEELYYRSGNSVRTKLPDTDIAAAKQKILSAMNEKDRELYDLIYVKKLTSSALSEITGRPIPTLRVQKSRLKEKLVKLVKEYFEHPY